MVEKLNGRDFVDLAQLERLLESREDVSRADAYFRWGEEHRLVLAADVFGPGKAGRRGYHRLLGRTLDKALPKVEIHCFQETV